MTVPNEIMRAWQQRLQAVAAAEGKPDPLPKFGADGLGGNETKSGIVAFQASRNPPLPQTGQFDAATRTALNPPPKPHVSSAEIAIVSAVISNLPFIPKELKEILMFPTIVQMIIAILPGVPDDIKLVEAEVAELASSDSGIKKLRTALVFGKALIEKIEAIVDKVDPQGAIQPPASQVAIVK
jgi:hypothetical protein